MNQRVRHTVRKNVCEFCDLIRNALIRPISIGILNDPDAIDDFLLMWRVMIKQNAALICFKEGSDEIIGLNMNFVTVNDEHFMEDMRPKVLQNSTFIQLSMYFRPFSSFSSCFYRLVQIIQECQHHGCHIFVVRRFRSIQTL